MNKIKERIKDFIWFVKTSYSYMEGYSRIKTTLQMIPTYIRYRKISKGDRYNLVTYNEMPNKVKGLEPIEGVNTTNDFFSGVEDITPPLYTHPTGYSFIIWNKLPEWFDEDPDLKYFKDITEKNFRTFKGIEDMTIHPNGDTIYSNDRKAFTISHKEYIREPIKRMYEKILQERENHIDNDMELTYINATPRGDSFIVEFAVEFSNVKIASMYVSEYNVNDTYSSWDCDVDLSGYMSIGLDIDVRAKKLLKEILNKIR